MGYMEYEEAIKKLEEAIHTTDRVNSVYIYDALGRTLAETIYSPIDVPPFSRSPLDGYAVKAQDIKDAKPSNAIKLKIVGKCFAGSIYKDSIKEGEALRIMTGAPIPRGADCIVRQENTKVDGKYVYIYESLKPYQNYVFRGEDILKGSEILKKGSKLESIELAILSGVGIKKIKVYEKLKVTLLAFGDEIERGEKLGEGKIYDMNLQMMRAECEKLKIKINRALFMKDDIQKAIATIKSEINQSDLIITTGGVSVGEKDIIHDVIRESKGETVFNKVNMKPGTPITFWLLEKKPIISLSGNPFAAFATFQLFAKRCIKKMTGQKTELKEISMPLENDFLKSSNKRRFIRGKIENGSVYIPQKHSPGAIHSMSGCDCLIDIPAGSPCLKAGNIVKVILL